MTLIHHNWLSPYRARYFAMVVDNQLVLDGGCDHRDAATNLLGVWEAQSREWTHPYPLMPIPRYGSSAVAYKQWLLVVGGITWLFNVNY